MITVHIAVDITDTDTKKTVRIAHSGHGVDIPDAIGFAMKGINALVTTLQKSRK
jgi:hypothetical protein